MLGTHKGLHDNPRSTENMKHQQNSNPERAVKARPPVRVG